MKTQAQAPTIGEFFLELAELIRSNDRWDFSVIEERFQEWIWVMNFHSFICTTLMAAAIAMLEVGRLYYVTDAETMVLKKLGLEKSDLQSWVDQAKSRIGGCSVPAFDSFLLDLQDAFGR